MANGLPRIQIINQTEVDDQNLSWMGTQCFIDGKKIKPVKGVDFRVRVDEVPTFTFETVGMPDIDMQGQVFFQFTPQTVGYAAEVLRHEFKANPESRKALVDSIASAIKEMPSEEELWSVDVAEMIANRIIGLEAGYES